MQSKIQSFTLWLLMIIVVVSMYSQNHTPATGDTQTVHELPRSLEIFFDMIPWLVLVVLWFFLVKKFRGSNDVTYTPTVSHLFGVVESLVKMDRLEDALACVKSAELINELHLSSNKAIEAHLLSEKSNVYFKQGKLDIALDSIDSSIQLANEASALSVLCIAQRIKGEILIERGEIPSAKESLESSLKIICDQKDNGLQDQKLVVESLLKEIKNKSN